MSRSSWVIFDADNTLWHVEHLYDAARDTLCDFLSKKGFDAALVKTFQRTRDKQLYATYGYSACRFARSFEDTIMHFCGTHCDDRDIMHGRRIALEVFETDPRYEENLDHIFAKLKSKYKIGLITAGEKWVQERRLARFNLIDEIDEIEVVEKKTQLVFENYMRRHHILARGSWLIGDSINSDIKPALAAGLNAIWYRSHNWLETEGDIEWDANANKHAVVERLDEILPILLV